jgi:hypothetical protein
LCQPIAIGSLVLLQQWATTKTKIEQIKNGQIKQAASFHINFGVTNLKAILKAEKVQGGDATMFHIAL